MVIFPHHRAFVVSGSPRGWIKHKEDIAMRKRVKRKTILIDGIRYYADKPDTCRKCFFWKNRKVG